MNYALIRNETVIALVGIYPSNWQQFDAVVPVYYNVSVGDEYVDGRFYRNGVLVPTPEEQMSDMRNALEILGVSE